MGNAITAIPGATSGGGGGGRKAKIMKANGEFFKHGTPAKVGDIIANYPGHILLDSDEFLRFNLRAQPLDPEFELQPKKIYLLVELPKFPTAEDAENTLRRTISNEIVHDRSQSPVNFRLSQRSISDLSLTPRSEAVRVKVKLPKAQVEKILEQSKDDVEAAEKIIDLCRDEGDRVAGAEEEESSKEGQWTEIEEDETTEKVSFSKYCVNLHPTLRIPCANRHNHSKYKKLTND